MARSRFFYLARDSSLNTVSRTVWYVRTIKGHLAEDDSFMRASSSGGGGAGETRRRRKLRKPSLAALRAAHPDVAGMSHNAKLAEQDHHRMALPVKQVAAARLIPRRAAHGDHGLPRGVPLPDWFWASVTASTLAHATGSTVEITAPEGAAPGYRELIQATSKASYLRLAAQCVRFRAPAALMRRARVGVGRDSHVVACECARACWGTGLAVTQKPSAMRSLLRRLRTRWIRC